MSLSGGAGAKRVRLQFRDWLVLTGGIVPGAEIPATQATTRWPPSAYSRQLGRACFICGCWTVCDHRERELVLHELGFEVLR